MPTVVVDAMGGDHAPLEVVRGAVDAASNGVDVLLVGDEVQIAPVLKRFDADLPIVHANEVIEMGEDASRAVRAKKDASIMVAARLIKDGEAQSLVSAGSTGAALAASAFVIGRLPGVSRPAIASVFPTREVVLDVGANIEVSPEQLTQFGVMGYAVAQVFLEIEDPRVGLLNIGEEAGKGRDLEQAAYPLLAGVGGLNFVGNVEGRDVPSHPADVVVCDASVGNVTMKFFEGLSRTIFGMLEAEFKRLPWGPLGYFFMRPGIGRIRERFDYEKLGGSPLLGVNGTVLISHGSAKRRMIGYAVEVTAAAARANIPERISAALASEGVDKRTAQQKTAALHSEGELRPDEVGEVAESD